MSIIMAATPATVRAWNLTVGLRLIKLRASDLGRPERGK